MADLHSLVDKIHYDGRRRYTKQQGNVVYLDGTRLMRPSDMPRTQRAIALVIVILAIILGWFMINRFVVSHWRDAANAEQALADNLAREPSIDTIPLVANLINLGNDAIKSAFAESGYTIYDASAFDESNDMVLYKIPSDMSLGDAVVLYQQGIGSLNAEQASRLLTGSWYFAADRVNATSMVVRYADFSTGDPQIAVQNAVAKEGFDLTATTDSGTDDSGNTFISGTLDAEGTPCSWKISALPLEEMYSVAGLPEDSCYVGIRVTAQ